MPIFLFYSFIYLFFSYIIGIVMHLVYYLIDRLLSIFARCNPLSLYYTRRELLNWRNTRL